MQELAQKISTLRKQKNMTQAELGAKLNVSAQAVSKWENNVSEPDLVTLRNISTLFEIPLDQLIGRNEIPETESVRESESEQHSREILGFCVRCGRVLYEGEDAELTPEVKCRTCVNAEADEKHRAAEEARREEERKLKAQKREYRSKLTTELYTVRSMMNRGLIWAAVITVIALGIAIGVVVSNFTFYPIYILWFVLGAYAVYAYTVEMFCDDGIVREATEWGLTRTVRFPGIIFSFDFEGLKFLFIMKILFAVLGFLAGVFFVVLGIGFGIFCAIFCFPFHLRKSLAKIKGLTNSIQAQ